MASTLQFTLPGGVSGGGGGSGGRGQQRPSAQTGAVLPPKDWLPSDAKDRFDDADASGLNTYLPGDATLLEILASRVFYTLNGCMYDFEENFIIMMLRPIGWGCRMALFLFSLIFCVMAIGRDTNPIGQYSFSRERDDDGVLKNGTTDDSDVFQWFVWLTFGIWAVSIATSAMTYLAGRYGAKQPYAGQLCASFPFVFCNRTAIDDEGGDGTRCGMMLILTVWFLGNAAAALAVVYTAMSHMYVKRNAYFAYLLLVLLALVVLGTLADALSLGGPTGIYVQSRSASWLASLRAVVIVPVQVIFTGFFVWLCDPPWSSV